MIFYISSYIFNYFYLPNFPFSFDYFLIVSNLSNLSLSLFLSLTLSLSRFLSLSFSLPFFLSLIRSLSLALLDQRSSAQLSGPLYIDWHTLSLFLSLLPSLTLSLVSLSLFLLPFSSSANVT